MHDMESAASSTVWYEMAGISYQGFVSGGRPEDLKPPFAEIYIDWRARRKAESTPSGTCPAWRSFCAPCYTRREMYYFSVIDGPLVGNRIEVKRTELLAGPYETHAQALDKVDFVRQIAEQVNVWAHFYAFGTLKLKEPINGAYPQAASIICCPYCGPNARRLGRTLNEPARFARLTSASAARSRRSRRTRPRPPCR